MAAGSSPSVPPLPVGASTATKVLFTLSAGAFIVSPIVEPYSDSAAKVIAAVGGAALAFGALIHVYWDHTP